MKQYFELMGFKVKDRVSGYTGIVTSIAFDLYGCVQAVVMPEVVIEDKSGTQKLGDGHWYDVKRLEKVGKKPVMDVPDYYGLTPKTAIGPSDKPAFSGHPAR